MLPDNSNFPTAAVIAASVAIMLWVLQKFFEMINEKRSKRKSKENYIVALYAEVDFNTTDMEIFLKAENSVDLVKEAVKNNSNLIPHITDARHTAIYQGNISNVSSIGKEILGNVVHFYGLLEKLKNQVSGLYLPSFKTISAAGREATIADIYETADECRVSGNILIERLETEYAGLALKRTPRPESLKGLTNAELAERSRRLSLDLSRVNNDAHKGASPT